MVLVKGNRLRQGLLRHFWHETPEFLLHSFVRRFPYIHFDNLRNGIVFVRSAVPSLDDSVLELALVID
jgi:hypothetical protein